MTRESNNKDNKLADLARNAKDYDEFREKALRQIHPDIRGSVGLHLLEFYVDAITGEV